MASSSAATEAQIKSEIERLTATISQHKAHQKNKSWKTGVNYYAPYPPGGPGRSNAYVNPNYKPSNKYVRPGLDEAGPSKPPSTATATPLTNQTPTATRITEPGPSTAAASVLPDSSNPVPSLGGQKTEVVLGGVAFESSRRSLVRKDLPKPASIGRPISTPAPHHYTRKPGHVHPSKVFKLKARRGRNMTLNNTRRPYPSSRKTNKRVNKYVDKPCPRFTTTGSCSRGLTCMYQHDPSKIAICWNFLQGNCPKTAETCDLSHEPTPERTPLCVHFLNKGRCTRENCPFPHVNVGQRQGVCRDFAVLGYCERGLECDRQHVRECPDFAEKGTCGTKGCKLPHVIRANRNRKVAAPNVTAMESIPVAGDKVGSVVAAAGGDQAMVTAEDGQLGDEFISLTFKESDSEDDDEEEEEEEDDESGSEESGSEIMEIVP